MQGIVNGIDYKTYDPVTDPKIYTNYNASNFRKKKVNNKLKLQEELDLTVDKKKVHDRTDLKTHRSERSGSDQLCDRPPRG